MGIFIHLAISHSVTKEEWKKVYEETLRLVEVFPLAEKRKVNIEGVDTVCLVPTKERKESYDWDDGKVYKKSSKAATEREGAACCF